MKVQEHGIMRIQNEDNMNEDIFEKLKYHSGLVAQGCWNDLDDYDQEAIKRFAELIIKECYETCKENLVNEAEAKEFGLTYNDAVGDCVIQIKQHFGVEE